MNTSIPQIETFINYLQSLRIGDYLKSNQFKRYCIKDNLAERWSVVFQNVKDNRMYLSPDIDHEYFDSIGALIILLNEMWLAERELFYNFSTDFLINYSKWSGESLSYKEFEEDLELLKFPQEHISRISKHNTRSVPKIEVPEEIWNSNRLEDYLKKMDDSINAKEYEQTLTYAYTCLEGLFKAFIREKVPDYMMSDKITQMATIIRDYLKNDFKSQNIDFPNSVLNLIPTMTHAVAEARNSYSSSHFDKNSDKWLSEFVRDCVNSTGRLIIKFI